MRGTALVLFALLAVGCGGDESDETSPPQSAPPAAPQAAPAQPGDTAEPGRQDNAGGRMETSPRAEDQAQREGQPQGEDQASAVAAEGERLYTVQVAAFLESRLAIDWTERLRSGGMPAWTSVAEVGGRTFHRVRVGAVPTVEEARRLGSRIMGRYEWPVWVTSLTPADRPPEGAVQETRRLLESE